MVCRRPAVSSTFRQRNATMNFFSSWIAVLVLAAGLGMLTAGGEFLVSGATGMARRLVVSVTRIGLTIVALLSRDLPIMLLFSVVAGVIILARKNWAGGWERPCCSGYCLSFGPCVMVMDRSWELVELHK